MLYFYPPNILQTFLEYFYQFFSSLDQSLYCLARVCAVNAAEARRGYLSGKILVLIISELCFAKQYWCCAPAKKFKIAHKKIPRISTRDRTKLTNLPSYLFCNTSFNNLKEPFIIVVSLIASSIVLKPLLCITKDLPSLEYQTSYVLLLGDKIIFVVIVIRI